MQVPTSLQAMDTYVGRRYITAMAVICAVIFCPEITGSANYRFAGNLIGILQNYKIAKTESLIELARKFDLGFNAIAAANPSVDPWIPPAGRVINIPTAWILPESRLRTGIVINLPELRMYYFPKKPSGVVVTFPLGIGDQGRDTPAGNYRVVEKITGPAWRVPKSIRSERPYLPEVVPRGPNNPLGSHALRLSRLDLLIHGTNRPWGIGRRSSHGCLRLYPEDIVKLFKMVPNGTPVTIINQPIKACLHAGKILVEAHRPESGKISVGQALHLLADKKLLARTDFAKLIHVIEEAEGMPVDVTLTH